MSAARLEQLLHSGEVDGGLMGWREGMSAWRPLCSLPELQQGGRLNVRRAPRYL